MDSKMDVKYNLLFLVSLFITYKAIESADDKSVLSTLNKLPVNQLPNLPNKSSLSQLTISNRKLLNKAPDLGKNVPIGGIAGAKGLSGLKNTLQLNKLPVANKVPQLTKNVPISKITSTKGLGGLTNELKLNENLETVGTEDQRLKSQEPGLKSRKNQMKEGVFKSLLVVKNIPVKQLTKNLSDNKLPVPYKVTVLTKNVPIGKITGAQELGGLTNNLPLNKTQENMETNDQTLESEELGSDTSGIQELDGVIDKVPVVQKLTVNQLTNKLGANKLPVANKVPQVTKRVSNGKITGAKGLGGLTNNLPLNKIQETVGTEDQRLKSQKPGLKSSNNSRKEGIVKNLPEVNKIPVNQLNNKIAVNKLPVVNKVPELTKNVPIGKPTGSGVFDSLGILDSQEAKESTDEEIPSDEDEDSE